MKVKQWVFLCLAGGLALAMSLGCRPQAPAEAHVDHEGHSHPHGEEHDHDDGHHHGDDDEPSPDTVTLTPAQEAAAGIKTEVVQAAPITEGILAPGTITVIPRLKAAVTPPAPGRIVELRAAPGAPVRKGQTLGVLESVELAEAWSRVADAERMRRESDSRVEDAQSGLTLAKAKLAAAKEAAKGQKALAQSGAFDQASLLTAQDELTDAQSEALTAKEELVTHREQLRRLESLFKDGLVSRSELDQAKLEVQKDQIRLDRAEARLISARAALDRERRTAGRGLLGSREVQRAEAEAAAAEIEAERARVALRAARQQVKAAAQAAADAKSVYRALRGGPGEGSRVSIAAPLDGFIASLDASVGQVVDRTHQLMEIEDLRVVWAAVQIPERDVPKAGQGMRVRITLTSRSGSSFDGVVESVSSRLEAPSRTLLAYCRIINPSLTLKPGMLVRAEIAGPGRKGLTVPSSSVVKEADDSFVFVEEGSARVKRKVELGASAGGRVEVLSGVKPGEKVVVEGGFVLKSHQKKETLKGHEH